MYSQRLISSNQMEQEVFDSSQSKNWNTERQLREIANYRKNILGIKDERLPMKIPQALTSPDKIKPQDHDDEPEDDSIDC